MEAVKKLRRLPRVLWAAGKDFFFDNGLDWAAVIAFYFLLSIFPLLLAATSVAAYVVDAEWALHQIMNYLEQFLARGTEEVHRIVDEAIEAREQAGIISLLLLIWVGSYVFGALTTALNIAYDVEETHPWWKRALITLTMLLTLGVFCLLAIISPVILEALRRWLGWLPAGQELALDLVLKSVAAVLLFLSFFLIYRFVPRRRVQWQAAVFGAFIASGLFLAARPIFVGYAEQFARYNLIYGSLAALILLLFWIWISAAILLYGGEVTAHAHQFLYEGESLKELEQRHRQHAKYRRG